MNRLLIVLLVLVCGCDLSIPQTPSPPRVPYVVPKEKVSVIMVSEPWCTACAQQRKILDELVRSGEIAGYEVVNSKHQTYKAKVLPTLYVCCSHGCRKLEGLSSKDKILRAAQD